MATITIDIPDPLVPEIMAIFRERYEAIIPEGATDLQVARRVIRYWMRQEIGQYRIKIVREIEDAKIKAAQDAAEAAVAAARQQVETDLAG